MIIGNVTDYIAYAADRGTTVIDEPATDQSLQRASDYIRTRYVIRYNLDVTSEAVIEATYIAAGYDLASPGFWQKTFTPAQAKVLTKVDDIQWTVTGDGSKSDSQLPTSPAIEALLAPYSGSGAFLLVV